MIGLQKPTPARPVFLRRDGSVAVSCKKDNLVFITLQQVILLGQPGKYVREKLVEVGVVCVW